MAGALAAVAILSLGAAPSAAMAQWSAPQALSRAHVFVLPTALGFTATGTAVASWSWQDGLGNDSVRRASIVSHGASSPAFGSERELPGDVISGPVPYAADRVVVARLQSAVVRGGRDTLRVQFGDVRGRLGPSRVVARRAAIRNVQLAANARGDAALSWFEDREAGNDRVYVSLRRSGRSFGHPIALAQEAVRSVAVAVGAAGHVLVAWDARGRIRTRFKAGRERTFRSADTLRSQDTFSAALRAAVAASGRAWVAWTAQFRSEGGDRGEAFVQAALRPAGARRFRPALLLARAPAWATQSPVSLALGADGAATLAWTTWDGGPSGQPGLTTVQAARLGGSGSPAIGQVTRFAQIEPGEAPAVAVGGDGTTLVAWTDVVDPLADATSLRASLQPAGGGWSAPELVSAGHQAMAPVAAYPPAGGPPIVLFADRPAGQLAGTVVQVAPRQGKDEP